MFTFLFNVLSRSVVVVLVAMLSVNYIPDSMFQDFPLEPRQVVPNDYDSVIPQNWNTKLSSGKPEYIQLNNILGPESIAIAKNGLLYTGLADGRLVELDPSNKYKLRTVARVNPHLKNKCPDNSALRCDECGRFLQVRFNNDTLYAIEAATGLYKVDTKSGVKAPVGPKSLSKVHLYNSFAFDPVEPNLIYITVSSTRWNLLYIVWSLFEQESTGQLLVLDTKTGKRAIVFDDMRMANGVDVDAKRDQVLVSETLGSKITSVSMKDIRAAFKVATDGGKLKGVERKALIPLVPGSPDNVIVEGDIAYVALPFVKLNGKDFMDHLGSMPNVRKAIGRFMFGTGKLLEYVCKNFYPHPLLETAYRELKCGHTNYRIIQNDKSAVLKYNLATGSSELLGSDLFGFISEAVPDGKGNLYLGSFRSPFIVKQKI
ncbi:adipocyte plasma membrane-associated -like [Olea europaea subsp. europaea]|uniref:Adipocyte plasma membrane-associated -like n=1 Tax=Olea europaea subsp. europaea TaxID=158383 RepID=A0A8S0Q5W8_OLEEU|nr:adipocyte plasma membrane-associated -like [Olea europaea subsp. europaea]